MRPEATQAIASTQMRTVGAGAWEEEALMTPYELQKRHLDDVWRYVSSRLDRREDAEDVTMEVMVSAFRRLGEGETVVEPKLWLLSIARRRVADALRTRYRRREVPLMLVDDGVELDLAHRQAVNAILDQMSEDHSQVLLLKYVNGLSTEEVAQVIGKSPEAANSLLQRARESFRQLGNETFPHLSETEEVK